MGNPTPDTADDAISVIGHLRASLRLLRLFSHVVFGSLGMLPLIAWSRLRGRPTPPTSWWYRDAVHIYGITVTVGEFHPPPRAGLVTANHISWMDIIILGSVLPVVFVSKSTVRQWPLIGWYAEKFGTIFLERGKHQAGSVGESIADGIRRGVSVVVFPEATTGKHTRPMRFYPRLFGGAIAANAPVIPAALAFPDESGHGMNRSALFIDDEPFLRSAWRTLAQPRTPVHIAIGAPLPASGRNRDELAEDSHAAVCRLLDDMIEDDRPATG